MTLCDMRGLRSDTLSQVGSPGKEVRDGIGWGVGAAH